MLLQWQTWPELFGVMPSAATKSYVISYLMYVAWALMFALFAAILVKLFAPYACGSGIPEVSYILSLNFFLHLTSYFIYVVTVILLYPHLNGSALKKVRMIGGRFRRRTLNQPLQLWLCC